jgi:hypothetical protein
MRTSTAALWFITFEVVLASACAQARRPGTGDDGGEGTSCIEGALRCDGNLAVVCAGGAYQPSETCPLACADGLGCVVCRPGTGTCNGNESHTCASDGAGYIDSTCDPMQGVSCDESTGACVGACAPQNLGSSYIGCDYFPTVTGNTAGTQFDFAVVIANTTPDPAMIHIEGGALTTPITLTAGARTVKVQTLPWVAALKLCNTPETDGCLGGTMEPAALAVKGAYRLRSDRPVTVYQFNALQYAKVIGSITRFSYSNDASLLLPTNVWRSEYYAAAWQHLATVNPSQLAVTAWRDDTMVTINARASTPAGSGAPAFTAGVPQTLMLNAGDVLEITTRHGDLTGSHVKSSLPVQVVSGHYCGNVPEGVSACDHMEESMFSVDALGRRYAISAPAMPSLPGGKVETIRIIATAPNTTLSYDPPQSGAPTTIAKAGDFVELAGSVASFLVTADEKVLVAQYMSGQSAGGGAGDPAMALAVPVEQFRTSYMFHAPTNYTSNHIDITAPIGAALALDNVPIAGLVPIGNSGFGLKRLTLDNGPAGDGSHSIAGDLAFGITVYGYGQYTSYWYAGGLDLADIIR